MPQVRSPRSAAPPTPTDGEPRRFGSTNEAALLTSAKLGILAASLVAGIIGWVVLSRWAAADSVRAEPRGDLSTRAPVGRD